MLEDDESDSKFLNFKIDIVIYEIDENNCNRLINFTM